MTKEITPLYRASGDVVFHRPITTVHADGTTSIRMGFSVCIVDPHLSGNDARTSAEEVAHLLNLGEGAKEAMEALRRIADLTPSRANARSADDLHATVCAIARTALDKMEG